MSRVNQAGQLENVIGDPNDGGDFVGYNKMGLSRDNLPISKSSKVY